MTERKQLLDIIVGVIDESLANLHTATIARVTAVGDTTISCKPVISRVVDGAKVDLPVFRDVPPLFMQGGGSYETYPIAVGDYALLIFTERCFDNWYAGRDNETPLEYRMHDYSDGFAIVGVNPLSGALAIPDKIKQVGDKRVEGDYDHQGSYDLTGDLTINGDIFVNGSEGVSGVSVDADLKQVTGRVLEAGNGATGTFTSVTVVKGIVTGGS